jgi:glucan phosphoethanolaminetransferase (alkaline phosphatase superfamily)
MEGKNLMETTRSVFTEQGIMLLWSWIGTVFCLCGIYFAWRGYHTTPLHQWKFMQRALVCLAGMAAVIIFLFVSYKEEVNDTIHLLEQIQEAEERGDYD